MNTKTNEDTIIAIATPIGVGAISIVRLSGPEAFRAIDKIFTGKNPICQAKSHTIHYGHIVDNNEIIDDILVSVFRAPNSYTAEDVIEISSHGSPLIAQKIISLILNTSDVRLADPGEFTKRAFLNGKIDLIQAEAVVDIINSRTSASLRGARNQLDGLLSSKVSWLRKKLVELSSFLELELDFSEEDIVFVRRNELIQKINEILVEISRLLNSYSVGKVVRDGVNVAIVGEPNVGKSSLLNYLLMESRAIVSDFPGTTRDTISEEISIDGILIKLIDTAGIRHSKDLIEKEGVTRSKEAIKNADIILFVGDVNVGFSEPLNIELHSLITSGKIIKLLNKIDLGVNKSFSEDLKISVKTGEGITQLIEELKIVALQGGVYSEKVAIVTSIRHYRNLAKSKENLENALKTLSENLSGEFVASDLRAAEISLAEIIGEVTPDDILNNIFSKFCIGK
jgi:tRNA modification GTPase